MPPKKNLRSAITAVLTKIDLDAPVPIEEEVQPRPAQATTQPEQLLTPKHITDIIGNLSLDLD